MKLDVWPTNDISRKPVYTGLGQKFSVTYHRFLDILWTLEKKILSASPLPILWFPLNIFLVSSKSIFLLLLSVPS